MFKCVVTLFLIMCGFKSYCQDAKFNFLDSFSHSLLKSLNASESEKAYLAINKSIYKTGEVIWFRAFLLHSISEKISTKSKYLFVDLVDNTDKVVSTTILNSRQQQTNGKIALPDSLSTGYYWVRAYTQQMASVDTNNIAVQPVYILNPAKSISSQLDKGQYEAPGEIQPILEIFPEGGSIITGINSTLAFYVHDQNYHPLSVNGVIKDNRDSVVSEFGTDTYGLGKAEFSPVFYYKYKAVIHYSGKEMQFKLPPFNRFAGQLSVSNVSNGRLKCRVILEDSIYRKDAVTYIIGFSRNQICFAGIGYGSYESNISLRKFPDGLATLLLFDKSFKLLSERNIYVRNNAINVKISTDNTVYRKRSKGNLLVSVTDMNNYPVSSSLAVSISDSVTTFENELFNKTTDALKAKEGTLSNWDIMQQNSISEGDLDLLMICMKSKFPEVLLPVKEINDDSDHIFYISGKVLDKKDVPLPNKDVTLISNSEVSIFTDTTNSSGKFNFAISAFPDSIQFLLLVNNRKAKSEYHNILLDKTSFPLLNTPKYFKLQPELSNSAKTKFHRIYADTSDIVYKNDWLKPVTVKTKATNYDHSHRISSTSVVISSERLLRLGIGNIGLALLLIPGASMFNGSLSFYGPDFINSEPLVLYDGNEVSLAGTFDHSSPVIGYLNSLDPRVIDFIEVLKGPEASIYGLRGGSGVIYIHSSSTIKQDFKTEAAPTFKFFKQGISKPVFYPTINYNSKELKNLTFVDTRSTLYWNGNELTDNNGNINYTFYTNDIPGIYRITITGLSIHGDLIYKTLFITNR